MGTSRGRFLTYNVELGGVRVAIFFNYLLTPLISSDYKSACLEFQEILFSLCFVYCRLVVLQKEGYGILVAIRGELIAAWGDARVHPREANRSLHLVRAQPHLHRPLLRPFSLSFP